jgi:xanthine dehydrogenase accessory factor
MRAETSDERSAVWTCIEGGAVRRGRDAGAVPAAVAAAFESTVADRRFRRVDAANAHWFIEPVGASRQPLWLYGAGHVAQALLDVLAALPFDVTCIDSRDAFAGGRVRWSEAPEVDVRQAPRGAIHLVMTHDHDLDCRIVESILLHGSFGFCGLIGSKTKAARFRSRLLARGLSAGLVARVACPVGRDSIGSKLPAAVAIGIAAQLLSLDAAALAMQSTVGRSTGGR